MSGHDSNIVKNHSDDRTLVLKIMDGKDALDTQGMVDKRLFKGGNRLRAIMDPEYGHWYVMFDSGIVPPPLQQRFTSFTRMYEFVSEYYKRRNIEIVEVIDN